MDGQSELNVNFTVECHGLVTKAGNVSQSQTTIVSTHWIRSCLEVLTTLSHSCVHSFLSPSTIDL